MIADTEQLPAADPLPTETQAEANVSRSYLFTPETARRASLLSAQSRKAAKERLHQLLNPDVQPVVTPLQARIARLEKRMTAIELKMDGNPPASVLRDLTASYARLFDVWCVLTGTQRPGTARKRSARTMAPGTQDNASGSPTPLQVVSPADPEGYNLPL